MIVPLTWVPPEEYFRKIPRKWIGVAAIFSNAEGRLLLVKPTYKDRWAPVGGAVEAFADTGDHTGGEGRNRP